MRVKIRKEIDFEAPIELSELSPLDRVITSIKYKWRESKLFQMQREKEINKAYRLRIDRIEGLKDIMMAFIVAELAQNKSLAGKGEICETLILSIDRSYEDIIEDVLDSKDFLSFDISIIEENVDMLLAFPNLPMLIEIRKKIISEEEVY